MKKPPLPLPWRSAFFVMLAALLLTGRLMAGPLVVAYVPNWMDLKSFSETIDYGKLTHINVAFENPVNDAGDLSFSSRNEVLISKARANGVKVLISIGGGAASDNKALKARYIDLLSAASG